jgi:hypothetical protein
MNAQRTPKATRATRSVSEPSGSGTRRRSSQPKLPAPAAAHDPELETRLFMLVTAVAQDEGMSYDPTWAAVVHAAKLRGYVREKSLRLYLASGGRQWLASRAASHGGREFEMTKIRLNDRLKLKALALETGVSMQETIGHVIGAIHEHRDELTRIARRAGMEHPWEAVGELVRQGKKA